MEKLEEKYNLLENGQFETAIKLVTKKENKLIKFLKVIKDLILGTNTEKIMSE